MELEGAVAALPFLPNADHKCHRQVVSHDDGKGLHPAPAVVEGDKESTITAAVNGQLNGQLNGQDALSGASDGDNLPFSTNVVMRPIDWSEYYLSKPPLAFMPVAADGVRVHYGGLVNHGLTSSVQNSEFVIMDVGGNR